MKGSVSIIQGNTILSSDYAEISFNVDKNELERFYASGNVVLKVVMISPGEMKQFITL